MKGMWQSRRDHAQMVERCFADETVEFDVFYGVSDNDRRWFDIDHAGTSSGTSRRTTERRGGATVGGPPDDERAGAARS